MMKETLTKAFMIVSSKANHHEKCMILNLQKKTITNTIVIQIFPVISSIWIIWSIILDCWSIQFKNWDKKINKKKKLLKKDKMLYN